MTEVLIIGAAATGLRLEVKQLPSKLPVRIIDIIDYLVAGQKQPKKGY
jgi:hypothetical protein